VSVVFTMGFLPQLVPVKGVIAASPRLLALTDLSTSKLYDLQACLAAMQQHAGASLARCRSCVGACSLRLR